MKQPLVSIIMSEYNTPADYLHTSIKSVLDQTFKDFELILIDDCGKNDVSRVASEYEDVRILVIKNDRNRGLVYSLNRAAKKARGKYLMRMDTDDIAYPERLERQIKFLENHPEYSVVGARAVEFSEDEEYGILGKSGEKTKKDIAHGDALIHPSVIMHKKAVLEAGGYPDYSRAEDLALWCELLLIGSRLYVMEDVLLKYRVNPNDYKKRTLKHRGGEISARVHYYPKLGVGVIEYGRIIKSIISGIMPAGIVEKYRKKFILRTEDDE